MAGPDAGWEDCCWGLITSISRSEHAATTPVAAVGHRRRLARIKFVHDSDGAALVPRGTDYGLRSEGEYSNSDWRVKSAPGVLTCGRVATSRARCRQFWRGRAAGRHRSCPSAL